MKKATTLARTGPVAVNLDAVEAEAIEPEAEEATIVFRGRRVPVSADTKFLPLHIVQVKPVKK